MTPATVAVAALWGVLGVLPGLFFLGLPFWPTGLPFSSAPAARLARLRSASLLRFLAASRAASPHWRQPRWLRSRPPPIPPSAASSSTV